MSSHRFSFAAALVASVLSVPPDAGAESIAIDFGRQTTESSALLFGGCKPEPAKPRAWDKLEEAGVTLVRFGVAFDQRFRAKNVTLEDYRAAMGRPGSIADLDSAHWDWSELDAAAALARKHHMKLLLGINYNLSWLGYGGDTHAPPRDWAVWEDIVRQLVRRFADRVDYWEIWNEPNGTKYLKLKDSPYGEGKDGMLLAYLDICRHTLDAIRESGVKTRVGGPALATFNSAPFWDKFLAHAEVASRLDFLSHHIYFHAPLPNRCYPPAIIEMEGRHGIAPKALFITEWNSHSGVDEKPHELKNTPASVGWMGKSFVLFLQWGVRGAAFYNLHEGRAPDDQLGGAYKVIAGEPQLFRFMKVFHLLSRVLGLGDPRGPIRVCDSRVEGLADESSLPPNFLDSLYAVGCVNAGGVPVAVVANPSAIERPAELAFTGLSDGTYRVRGYIVRSDHTPAEATVPTLLFERTLSASAGQLRTELAVAAHSVVGLRLEHLAVT